jgi:hypothetical protein
MTPSDNDESIGKLKTHVEENGAQALCQTVPKLNSGE